MTPDGSKIEFYRQDSTVLLKLVRDFDSANYK